MSTNSQSQNETSVPASNNGKAAKRRKLIITAITIFLIAGVGYGGYHWTSLNEVDTDDAYVGGNLVQITPQVGGTVTSIVADDTQFVQAGQVLVKLDGADTSVVLEQAVAQLAQAVRAARVTYAQTSVLQSQVVVRQTDVTTAQANLDKAEDTLHRRQELDGTGAVGAEELSQAQIAVQTAKSMLNMAQAGVKTALALVVANEAQTDGIVLAQNPNVRLAASRVREAYLAYERTTILAPVTGMVARRTVQLGQRVVSGTPLMSVVPLSEVWVDANFKETQLRELRIGQLANVTTDIYGDKVNFVGKVVGISAGSGAAYALLPAQNATGNWIKVVQRVPVRIALDPAQLAKYPLRVGLSTKVTVNTTDHSGPMVVVEPPIRPAMQTDVYVANWDKADALVTRIIVANTGGMPSIAGQVSRNSR